MKLPTSVLRKTYQIAKQIRNTLDTNARSYRGFLDKSMSGACALASFCLAKELLKVGVSCKVAHGWWRGFPNEHVFVVVDGVLIVDITATQMGGPGVFMAYIGSQKSKDYSAGPEYFPDDQFAWWYFRNWPKDLQPTDANMKRLTETSPDGSIGK